MPDEEQSLNEILQALLGVIDNISNILKNTPQKIEAILKQLYEFNRLSLKSTMVAGLSDADAALLKQTRNVIDQEINPYIEANDQIKKGQKIGLEEVEKHKNRAVEELDKIQENIRKPQM